MTRQQRRSHWAHWMARSHHTCPCSMSVCRWVCLGNVHFYNTRYRIAPHGFLCLPRAHPRQCVVPEWTQAAGGRQKPPLRPLAAPHKPSQATEVHAASMHHGRRSSDHTARPTLTTTPPRGRGGRPWSRCAPRQRGSHVDLDVRARCGCHKDLRSTTRNQGTRQGHVESKRARGIMRQWACAVRDGPTD